MVADWDSHAAKGEGLHMEAGDVSLPIWEDTVRPNNIWETTLY